MRYEKRIRMLPAFLLAAVALLLAAPTTRAESIIVPSVEWLVCQAERVVTGDVELIREVKGPGSVIYRDYRVRVSQTSKGKSEATLEFSVRDMGDDLTISAAALSAQHEFLLLLSPAKPKDFPGEDHLHNRLMPLWAEITPTVIDLSAALPDKIFSKDMVEVTNRERLLEIVRNWAASPIRKSLVDDIPWESPIFIKIYKGSSCGLFVPADEKHRKILLRDAYSPDEWERRRAAYGLQYYPGEESEQTLYALLEDQSLDDITDACDSLCGYYYPIREDAYHSLQQLGKKPRTVPLKRYETPRPFPLKRVATEEEKRQYRLNYWRASFSRVLMNYGQILSVEDQPARIREGKETQCVIVTFTTTGDDRCIFTLQPAQWPGEQHPAGIELGIKNPHSQDARRFFLRGPLPDFLREKVIAYFELQPEQ